MFTRQRPKRFSAMVGFMLFATLLLLPLTSAEDLPPGRTLLIETVDEPKAEHQNNALNNALDNALKEKNKLPTEHIPRDDDGNDYSLDSSEPLYKAGKKHFCTGLTISHGFKVDNLSLTQFPIRIWNAWRSLYFVSDDDG